MSFLLATARAIAACKHEPLRGKVGTCPACGAFWKDEAGVWQLPTLLERVRLALERPELAALLHDYEAGDRVRARMDIVYGTHPELDGVNAGTLGTIAAVVRGPLVAVRWDGLHDKADPPLTLADALEPAWFEPEAAEPTKSTP